jgi:fumarate hydratase class II
MPKEVYHAYGYVKKAAALVNTSTGHLPRWKAHLIARVADEVIARKLDSEFPLYVWQTGSGTRSNMNVISNRAIQLVEGTLDSKIPIHPNDDVNMSQSSNDTFPTAMHIATVFEFSNRLIPTMIPLKDAICRIMKSILEGGRHISASDNPRLELYIQGPFYPSSVNNSGYVKYYMNSHQESFQTEIPKKIPSLQA